MPKLRPPYDRAELARLFGAELAALKELLSPAIEDFGRCRSKFIRNGFLADEPYEALLRKVATDEIGKACKEQLRGRDPHEVSLTDFVTLYPNRMLQPMPGWPTPRVSYRACLGDAVYKERRSDLDAALTARWAAFALEADQYADTAPPAGARARIVKAALSESLARAGFATFSVSRESVKRWHPRPGWVDAAIGILQHDKVDMILLGETPRPRAYAVLADFSSEPNRRDTAFDQIEVSLWAMPKREIPELDSWALAVAHRLFNYYWDFYSFKGLPRITDAHVTATSILLGKA